MSLIPENQVNNSLISENIKSIINYYVEDHKLKHKNIMLYCEMSFDEFEKTLKFVRQEIPHVNFEYTELNKDFKNTCQLTKSDLSIIIPQNIFTHRTEIYEYNFQSHRKNIFGKMTFDIDLKDKKIIAKKIQFVTTSIGC